MKIIQFRKAKYQGFGRLEDNHVIPFLSDKNPFNSDLSEECFEKDLQYDLTDCELLAPINPSKVVGIALNYPGVSDNIDKKDPLVFMKGSNAVISSDKRVSLPKNLGTWGEAELAFVIKKEARNISIADVESYILGFCVANDMTCHNTAERDHHLARSKSQDGFCPIGTFIDTNYNYECKEIMAYQNAELIRKGNTSDMIFKIDQILVYLSSFMTLLPGDIILTGSPPRVREKIYLNRNDTYTISIEDLEQIETKFI
tara:strand:+ start:71 stop:841 length:771 start_codon:yes stop_codon:yes gene_type:complete